MTAAFTADAALALGGPEWLARRRAAAVERLAGVAWPTPSEEIWRYSRIDQLDLDRYRPFSAEELGAAGDERAPGGGPWAAEAGRHAGMIVVRDGRVVHHELDAALEAKGVRVCGIATCDDDLVSELIGQRVECVRGRVHRAPRRVPRGRRVRARSRGCGRRGPDPRVALERGRRPRVVPAHARLARRGCAGDGARPLRLPANRPSRRRGHRAARRRQRAPALPDHSGTRIAHLASRSAARARRSRRDPAHLGGRARRRLLAPAQRSASGRPGLRERPARGVLRRRHADARLPHAPGPRRPEHPQRPVVQGCGRGHRRARSIRGSSGSVPRQRKRTRRRRTATSC